MTFTQKNVGEYWLTNSNRAIKIYDVDYSDDYPVEGKYLEAQTVECWTTSGQVWHDQSHTNDLLKQIDPKNNPEYFV